MKYFRKIEGSRVYLSPMNVDDAQTYVKWLSDAAVTDGLGSSARLLTVEAEKEWIKNNAGQHQFAIVLREGDALIGNCGFHEVDASRQCAELGLFIGEAENRGKGYGAEVLHLMLRHAFETLNIRNVMLRVFAFNEQAIWCYGKVGFREMGRRRQAYFVRGAFHDEVFMDVLRDEYLAQAKSC